MNIFEILEHSLEGNNHLLDENGKLNKEAIKTASIQLDSALMSSLISNEDLKLRFFKDVNGVLVFDRNEFIWVISNKEFLPDSYTMYKNRIGLTDSNDSFIKNKNDVFLSFPFKDCFLVGDQKEDNEKRSEIFFNTRIKKDEIDTLTSPKCFTSIKKYEKGVYNEVEEYRGENLLIKGNNIFALYSLLPRFRGKVKLIFLDPPYNTENDTFQYNDNFNHSSWLTFMKNRLEIARELLSEDGSIYLTIDYNEVHYLKVLMDEVFGRENFQREIIWRMGFISGYKTMVKNFVRNHDTILFYSKNPKLLDFKKIYIENKDFKEILKPTKELIREFGKRGIDEDTCLDLLQYINYDSRGERYALEDTWNSNKWDDLESIAIESSTSRVGETVIVDDRNFKGQKPEKLLKRIIESATDEEDIVLDFFLGSGTTAAAAHKLRRKYIGIEQMSYFDTSVLPRLEKIVDGEDKDGITESSGWDKGGSFIAMELKDNNYKYLDMINDASDEKCIKILSEILNDPFAINYKCDAFKAKSKEGMDEFKKLPIIEKKRILFELVDVNTLYVNYSEIEDNRFNFTDTEKNFNKSFYKE